MLTTKIKYCLGSLLILSLFIIYQVVSAVDHTSSRVVFINDDFLWERSISFETDAQKYTISKTGLITQDRGKRGVLLSTQINNLQIYAINKNLLIAFENSTTDGGATIISVSEKTMTEKWRLSIPTFNLGEFFIKGNHIFVSGIGFIAKINMMNGNVVWEIATLYQNNHFNFFKKPYESSGFLIFEEKLELKEVHPFRIKIDPDTGEYWVLKS